MKERPILFSASMVRSILEGRKTQTRRVFKPIPAYPDSYGLLHREIIGDEVFYYLSPDSTLPAQRFRCPYGQPGDHLWVRETWRRFDAVDECGHSDFPCSCPPHGSPLYRASHDDGESKWRPSIHMPRWASRITLLVTSVRVERLQDISEGDAVAEGVVCPRLGTQGMKPETLFRDLWQSINGKRPVCSWGYNPWVWVIEFERIKQEPSHA